MRVLYAVLKYVVSLFIFSLLFTLPHITAHAERVITLRDGMIESHDAPRATRAQPA